MRWLSNLGFRVRALLRRTEMERELVDEFDFHLRMETEKYEAQGYDPVEARRLALVKFGGVERQKENARASWGVSAAHDLGADLRYAVRQLRKHVSFSSLAVITLGLGIGGTVALGSVAYGLLMRPLPVDAEDELVTFWSDYDWRGVEFDYLRDRTRVFDGLAAWSREALTLRTGERSSMVLATVASAELFDVLGAEAAIGRTFREGEDRPGAEPVVVLSHGLWEQELGADAEIVGQRIVLSGVPTTVIGVMPEGFYFPSPDMRAWVPLELDPTDGGYQGNGWLVLTGRVAAGTTAAGLEEDVRALAEALGERFTYPDAWDKTRNPFVVPLREYLLGDVRPAVLLLLGAVGVVLLMACANVAALLLTRTSDRTAEMSIRTVMGAGGARLARQVLPEAVVLGLAGGAIGLVLASVLFDVLVASLPLGQGFGETLSLDWTTLSGAFVLSLVSGAAISLAPMRNLLRGDLSGQVLGERRSSGSSSGAGRAQRTLIIAEVLLSVVLVTGAVLLARSVDHLRALDTGLDASDVLAVDLFIGAQEASDDERTAFFDAVVESVSTLPGVGSVGLINRLPIRDGGFQGPVQVEDRPDLDGPARPNSAYRVVTPELFAAFDFELVEGRAIEESDRRETVPVTVVNETFARRMWPGQSALGRRIAPGGSGMFEVVGVVRNVAVHDLVSEAPMAAYYAWNQAIDGPVVGVLVVETGLDPNSLAPAVRRLVAQVDGRGVVGEVTAMNDVVDAGMVENLRLRFFLMLFSLSGLVLGSVGVYGVVSYTVEQRRAELGIRMALGARPRRMLGDVARAGMMPVVTGTVAGAGASLVASRVLTSFLYEVAPWDPASFAAATGILLGTGFLAVLLPALRASRLDPAVALRAD